MKKLITLFILLSTIGCFISCGPTRSELEEREKALLDSLEIIQAQKAQIEIKKEQEAKKRVEYEKRQLEEEVIRMKEYNSRPEVIRQKLLEQELSTPLDYLSVKYKLDYKVFSGDDVIEGSIYSSSTLATFKDVKLEVVCISETGSIIRSYYYTIYDFVYPSRSTKFNIRLKTPKATKQIGVSVVDALSHY